MGFRYDGKLQSIHHVEDYEIVDDLTTKIAEMYPDPRPPHFLYTLGPAIRPAKEVKTGPIHGKSRLKCMLDTLLTSDTVAEAHAITKERANAAGISL